MGNDTNNQPLDLVPESNVTQIQLKNNQSDNNIQSFEEHTLKQEQNQSNTEEKENRHTLEKKKQIWEVENNITLFNSQLLSCLEFYKDLTWEDYDIQTKNQITETKHNCKNCLDLITEKEELINKYSKKIDEKNEEIEKFKQKIENLKIEVYTDELTQINNRKRFFQYYNAAISEAEKVEWKKFTLAIIDVDNFKFLNDTYWHPAWDIVLKLLTSIITRQIWDLHTSTAVCRIWWEEFAVISRKSPEDIYNILEKTLKILSKNSLNIDNVPNEYRLSFSAWISKYLAKMKGNHMDLFKDADKTMFEAKSSWKWQIQISNNK